MNKADVCGIIVTWHPDADLVARLIRIAPQVQVLIIVDNGSAAAEILKLHEAARLMGIDLILNPQNLGIARALNIGADRAIALGYSWVLLLDQDSVVGGDLIETLIAIYDSFDDKEHLALVGSGYRDLGRELARSDNLPAIGNDRLWDETTNIITSGTLLSLAAHAIIGPFREEFFIDHVDFEYCLRARAQGFHILNSRRLLMRHLVGAPTIHKGLWKQTVITNHSADRLYYFARNDTVLLRESGKYKFATWAIKSFARRFRTCRKVLMFEQSKSAKILAVCRGLWDGLNSNMGPRKK